MTLYSTAPNLILFNGVIQTQDVNLPSASAVAVCGERIGQVGDDKTILDLAGPNTVIENLNGAAVLPGFTDTHFHVYEWALNRQNLVLADVRSYDELIRMVQAAARKSEAGQWISGQGWNENDWPEKRMPNRHDLDKAAPHNPVFLMRCDLHLTSVNTKALELAGIDAKTPDPPEGKIEHDQDGSPNGILRELAVNLIRKAMPAPTDAEIEQALQDSIPVLHSLGITGVHDIRLMKDKDGVAAFRGWQRLNETGNLDLRCWVTLPGESLDQAVDLGLRTGFGDARLRIGHLKFFADGGMGARTAWMIDKYTDAGYGMPLTPPDELEPAIKKADSNGLSVMVHAIGDRANRELAGIFERLADFRRIRKTDELCIPHRIEHVQMIRPQDLKRLAKLNLSFCVQPHNMILDIDMIDTAVGPLSKYTYTYRNLIDTGRPVMFSSDSPVCDPSPLVGICAAVSRQRPDGTPQEGWHPENRVDVSEAVQSYTLIPARVHAQEHNLGSITPGKYADMVVLERDICTVKPLEIADINVKMTLFNGSIVYRRSMG
ncbi:amidohydrolase [Desulfococcaceae bacterium HSG9]|nr:amidohydrolase [Desulfococcaceae bacterium HSG9]